MLSRLSTKLSTVAIFLFIGVFASLADAPPVFAQVAVYESYETGGDIITGVNTIPLLGTFDLADHGFTSPVFFDTSGGVWAGFSLKDIGDCSPIAGGTAIMIASTTDVTLGANPSIWNTTTNIVLDDVNYTFVEATADIGAGVWLIPGHTYGIYAYLNCNGRNISAMADSNDLIAYGYLSWDGSYGSQFQENAQITRIISVDPMDQEVVASSTDAVVGASVYVNEIDWDEDMIVRLTITRNEDQMSTLLPSSINHIIEFDGLLPGHNVLSTTTPLTRDGRHTYKVELLLRSFWSDFFAPLGLGGHLSPNVFDTSLTHFIVNELTNFEVYLEEIASTTQAILADPGDVQENLDSCNPISGWDTRKCITGIFLPTADQVSSFIESFKTGVLMRVPLGYLTRFVVIVSNPATTTLPVISYEFATSSPLAGETLSFDFNGTITSASVILSDVLVSDRDDPQSVMEIFMPFWEMFVYLVLLFMVFHDVTNIFGHSKKSL